ncbi:hypothetical protein QBC37DRAFT_411492 [Rhypophila decipiens]|uniref:Secreted protein n=1 Tax=Rhypophila decipiens TaxID=261697 RepID=A0AAN7BCH3_9PEZI|nr:hypothetical protein QBC37DRAFT_411492 [Rhypophila decipiens]
MLGVYLGLVLILFFVLKATSEIEVVLLDISIVPCWLLLLPQRLSEYRHRGFLWTRGTRGTVMVVIGRSRGVPRF